MLHKKKVSKQILQKENCKVKKNAKIRENA